MRKLPTLQESIKREKENPKFCKAFDEEEVLANLAIQIARERERQGLTQAKLADILETKQQVVWRFEQDDYNYSVRTLMKLARAFHKRLHIKFV